MHLKVLIESRFLNRDALTKTLLIMKLTSILLILGMLQVSGKGFSQTISLDLKDVPLKQAFKEIRKQSGYGFVYGKEQLTGTRNITLKIEHLPIDAVLAMIFKDQPVTYTITDRYISVKQRPEDPIEK